MAIPDEDSGSSTYTYESFADPEDVKVKVTDLVTYYQEMSKLSGDAAGAASKAMSEMSMLVQDALNTPLEGQILPEGQQAARFLRGRISDFRHFVGDVTIGVVNIGGAAAVVAEMYANTDNANGANVNDIGFVFGDTDANGPRGFRKTETFQEMQQRLAAEAGTNAMSLTADNSMATSTAPYPYGAYYTFADGSQKHVHSSTEINANGDVVYVTTTTIYAADGKTILSTQTDKRGTTSDGRQTTSTTSTTGSGADQRSTTNTTTENSDGSVTVVNETKTGDAKPDVTETTVRRDSHEDGEVETPVEDAAETLDSDGQQHTVNDYGMA
ncbi:hypothetical protein [Phytohabitans rumicis]|uniref:Uncharacterized protein n=1 Tax=Phytohabitans rumicis TaxID=1076125 RepID=A0A6V8L1D8_9ACTN|nr:hypothetical protein [Phytohabitans rumicis]GFJ88748.1 hypothetical protein Prum_023900 [Phytohabitans rumicis]